MYKYTLYLKHERIPNIMKVLCVHEYFQFQSAFRVHRTLVLVPQIPRTE